MVFVLKEHLSSVKMNFTLLKYVCQKILKMYSVVHCEQRLVSSHSKQAAYRL
jgi:hypothetical protein